MSEHIDESELEITIYRDADEHGVAYQVVNQDGVSLGSGPTLETALLNSLDDLYTLLTQGATYD
jgi:hypothetical protein